MQNVSCVTSYRSRIGKGLCPICAQPKNLPYHNYCRDCRNAYARQNRTQYKDLSGIQRQRSISRAHVNVLKSRGKVEAETCLNCGSGSSVELHHPDIDNKPLEIVPLCRECHKVEHIK